MAACLATKPQLKGRWGPVPDRGLLNAGIYDPMVHQVWMCYLIYTRLPLNAQRLGKTLLPMFLNKLADFTLRKGCSAAAGGRFRKSMVVLCGYMGMNPGVQLVTELNTTHMSYIDLNTLSTRTRLARWQTKWRYALHEGYSRRRCNRARRCQHLQHASYHHPPRARIRLGSKAEVAVRAAVA